jgi:hypothetical protein
MSRKIILLGAVLILIAGFLSWPCYAKQEWAWTVTRKLNLQASPLDVCSTEDGKWVFVLTPGEVLMYSVPEDRVVNRMPVGRELDKLSYSDKSSTLILTSSVGKSLQIVQMDAIFEVPIAGLPFKGPENATVTVAIFDDYQ